jgi:uncharacterized membrane protein YphA (DoxX/SURF4 family)
MKSKVFFWVATVWLGLAMVASGIQQLFDVGGFGPIMEGLGYPLYFSKIIGFWKLLGVVVLLIPCNQVLKEWAYAGFFFVTSGAVFSHIFMEAPLAELLGPVLLLVMTVFSRYFQGKLVGGTVK